MRRHTEVKARDLKPCPFCGGEAAVERDKHGVIQSVDCSAICDLMTPTGVDWNSRPVEDALRARAEAAEQRAEAAEREVARLTKVLEGRVPAGDIEALRDRHEAWACGHAAGFQRGLQRDPLP